MYQCIDYTDEHIVHALMKIKDFMRKTVWFISVSGCLLMEKGVCTKGPIPLNLWCTGCLLWHCLVAKFIWYLAESI